MDSTTGRRCTTMHGQYAAGAGMTSQEETAQTLKDAGRRLTPQRLMILSAVKNAGGHLTASEILELVKESYPFMDASTVYR
ncbi:MAG: hypothetical protein FJ317_07330, partial [SAR202 cluster bacterium]|nr:hypothetical protein [SAR202 cluster bacterium]